MSKEKPLDMKDVLVRIIDKEVPSLMDAIMKNPVMKTEQKIRLLSILDTALYHLRLVRAGLE